MSVNEVLGEIPDGRTLKMNICVFDAETGEKYFKHKFISTDIDKVGWTLQDHDIEIVPQSTSSDSHNQFNLWRPFYNSSQNKENETEIRPLKIPKCIKIEQRSPCLSTSNPENIGSVTKFTGRYFQRPIGLDSYDLASGGISFKDSSVNPRKRKPSVPSFHSSTQFGSCFSSDSNNQNSQDQNISNPNKRSKTLATTFQSEEDAQRFSTPNNTMTTLNENGQKNEKVADQIRIIRSARINDNGGIHGSSSVQNPSNSILQNSLNSNNSFEQYCYNLFQQNFNSEQKNGNVHQKEKHRKSFPCNVEGCKRVFSKNKFLREHFQAIHLKIPLNCQKCNKAYNSSSKLKKHFKKCIS